MLSVSDLKMGWHTNEVERATSLTGIASGLPEEFLECLPDECPSCGHPTEITESLSILRCTNPKCGGKTVQRLVMMLKDLGVKNLGESKCENFLNHFRTSNPYVLFMYEPQVDGPLYPGCSMDFSWAIYEQVDERRKMQLWEYVKIGNLPGIRGSARKLLSDYSDLETFYDDLEAGGIPFVQKLLDIKGKSTVEEDEFDDEYEGVSVKAASVYATLLEYKNDLFQALEFVDIIKIDSKVLNVVVSRAVGGNYDNKRDFIDDMNKKFDGKVHLNFLESVSKDTHILVWSKMGPETSKVKSARKINEKRQGKGEGNLIPIMTAPEFESYLEQNLR